MSAEILQAYASIAGLLPAVIGLPILFIESRRFLENRAVCSHALGAYHDQSLAGTSS